MPNGPDAAVDDAQDPLEDTPADADHEPAQDTPGNTVDWESRYTELRAAKDRQVDQLTRRLAALESDDDAEPDDEPAEEAEPTGPVSNKLIQESWNLAERIYGEEAVTAYNKAVVILNKASTPADYVAAFEAYHEARVSGATPSQAAAAAPSSGTQQQPRVDPNRPDAGPDLTDIDQKAEAAKAKGDLRGFLASQIERAGFRG